MPRFDIISIGGATQDHTFITNEGKIFNTPEDLTSQKFLAFEYGAKINASEAYVTSGGGAANTAVSLTRLGFKTAIISRVGKDQLGRAITEQLKREHVHTGLLQIDNQYVSPFSCIIIADRKDKDRVVFTYSGCSQFLTLDSKKLSRLKAKWLYLTSLSGPNSLKNLKAVFSTAQQKNSKVYWNIGGQQINAGKRVLLPFLKQTDVLQLNKDEAIELVLSGITLGRKNPNHLNRPLYLLNILYEWGPRVVVITDGHKGAWAFDGRKVHHHKIKKAKTVDTTGVGDGFGSGFLAGLLTEKGNVSQALEWGMINSASVSTKVGAQNGLLFKKEMFKKLKKAL